VSLVVDASAAVGWIAPSQSTVAGERLLSTLDTAQAIAPAIFAIELRNALLKLERRGAISSSQVDTALARLGLLVAVQDGPGEAVNPEGLLSLARAEMLSVFDATYLDLALRERAAVASCDAPLMDAARRRGLQVHDLR